MISISKTSSVYIDSNVIIYYVEYRGELRDRAALVFQQAIQRGARLVTSELAIAECIYKPFRDRNTSQIGLYRTTFNSGLFDVFPLTGELVIRAAQDGGPLGLKLLDAIHYVTALETGCDVFVTSDGKFRSSRTMEVVGV